MEPYLRLFMEYVLAPLVLGWLVLLFVHLSLMMIEIIVVEARDIKKKWGG